VAEFVTHLLLLGVPGSVIDPETGYPDCEGFSRVPSVSPAKFQDGTLNSFRDEAFKWTIYFIFRNF
jgi:hypothetical protein